MLPLLLPLFLTHTATGALLRANGGENHTLSVSLVEALPYRAPTAEYTHPKAPGADIDPPGVAIYNTLDDVPTAKFLSRARHLEKCYAARPCWAAYVCGHRCDQVLMRVGSWCRKGGDWARCQKARKFLRCFPRVCFRRSGRVMPRGRPPASYIDRLSVAIVRYRRPLPKHEVLAKMNKQSSTQSAIFK